MSSRAANIRSKLQNTMLRFLPFRKITCLVTTNRHDIDILARDGWILTFSMPKVTWLRQIAHAINLLLPGFLLFLCNYTALTIGLSVAPFIARWRNLKAQIHWGFISTFRLAFPWPTIHTNPSRKQSFFENALQFKLREFENAVFSFSWGWKTFWSFLICKS